MHSDKLRHLLKFMNLGNVRQLQLPLNLELFKPTFLFISYIWLK